MDQIRSNFQELRDKSEIHATRNFFFVCMWGEGGGGGRGGGGLIQNVVVSRNVTLED